MKHSMVRGSLVSLGVRLLDLPCRYGFHLLIAATLGVSDTGRFYIAFSIMTALAGLGRLGIDQALTRQLAIDLENDAPAAPRALIRRALWLVLLASTVVAAVLASGASYFAHNVLSKPDLALPLALGALTIIPQNLGAAMGGALSGLHRVAYSQAIYSWLWPATFCIIAIPVIWMDQFTVSSVMVLIALSFLLAAIVGGLLVRRFLAAIPADTQPAHMAPLLKPGLSLFTLEITKLLITAAPAIVLGIFATAYETGLFALAWRIALIVNILISGVAAMAMPKFASMHVKNDYAGMAHVASQVIGLVLCLSLPATLCMLIFPETLLSFFGPGYDEGATTLRILAVGQIAAACFTAMPELLGMTSHRVAMSKINGVTMVVLLAGLGILTPLAGSSGAAVATSLAILLNGAAATWLAYRLMGVAPHHKIWVGVRQLIYRRRKA